MKNKKIDIIKKIIQDNKPILKESYNVCNVGIFGSYARGDYNKKSDIDIMVEFLRPIGFFDFIRLEEFLSNKIGIRVDLVTRRALKRVIKKDILKETIYI